MEMKKILKSTVICFTMAATLFSVIPSIPVNAAARSIEIRYINGDGVRLRKEGWQGGTVLELMYDGEKIHFYTDVYGTDTEYNYMQRLETGTYGYVDHHYTRRYYEKSGQ